MKAESKEVSFLRSSMTAESPVFDNSNFLSWFRECGAGSGFRVRRISFDEMDQWSFEPGTQNLVHASGRFFRIEGLRVETNFEPAGRWDQPIINQPEIGILGILSQRFGGIRHFLMQAKAEPGNINTVQLSPTVQATQSNYSQVHGGSVPNYLDYFTQVPAEGLLVDQLQTEQASRFLKKQNRNMIVDVADDDEVPVLDGFCWLTLGEIKKLQWREHFVNMDARSVISCIPYYDAEQGFADLSEAQTLAGFEKDLLGSIYAGSGAMHSMDALSAWLTKMKTRYQHRVESIPLADVKNWKITESEIVHESRGYFSVIAVAVEAGAREVARWTQPMLRDAAPGLHGFITQKHAGVLHFLVQGKVEPGNLDVVDLAPTVSRSNIEHQRERASEIPFLDRFLNPRPEEIRYSVLQSEEGGRFFRLENRNTILELDPDSVLDLPEQFIWMTLGQLLEFLKLGHLSVDARTLLSCASLVSGAEDCANPDPR